MVRILQTTINNTLPLEIETSRSDALQLPKESQYGLGGTKDSFEVQTKASSLREIIQAATSEHKTPITQRNLNRFIEQNLKPDQYIETFRDLKGWVSKNFYLTPQQTDALNSLSKESLDTFQKTIAEAASSNKKISIQFFDQLPLSESAELKFVGFLTDDLKRSIQETTNNAEQTLALPAEVAGCKRFGALLEEQTNNQAAQSSQLSAAQKNIEG